MNQRTLLDRLLSPAGFGLVPLMFLLPFLTVSCGEADKIKSTFTGIDLVVGGSPDIVGPGVDAEVEKELIALFSDHFDLEPLMLLATLAVLAGMIAGLIRERLARHGVGTGLAVLAGALIVSAIMRAPARVDAALSALDTTRTPSVPASGVETRYGFWLALGLLALLAAGHAVVLARAWRTPAPSGAADPEEQRAIDG